MKRFYTDVSVAPDDTGFAILLDQRGLKTPAKRPVTAPSEALAQAVAEEWRDQGETLMPTSMPLTRCLNTALDTIGEHQDAVVGEVQRYAGSDLLCYRAPDPDDLVTRQRVGWAPHLAWAEDHFGVRFTIVHGLMPVDQPPATVATLQRAVSDLDRFRLTAVHLVAAITGSLVLALRLDARAVSGEEVWAAAALDESFQAELWGEDPEAAERRAAMASDVEAADRFLSLLAG